MISTDQGQNQHQQGIPMSSVTVLSEVAGGLVQRERKRSADAATAKATVARRLRIGAGSLTNIIKRRVKAVSADVRDRIVQAAIADLSHEISKLEHERECLSRMGASATSFDLQEVEASISSIRQTLDRMR